MKTLHHFLGVACALFVVDIGSRADDQIRTYSVPKEHPAVLAAQDATAPPATSDIPVNAAPVHYTLPSGWQQLPPDGVRLVNLSVPGRDGNAATVAITSFPGQVGTELDNVNRWRGQLGLQPVTGTDIASEPLIVDGTDTKLYDMSGATARTIVVVDRRDGATWFIKMNGDLGTVTDAKPAFIDFAKSIHFASPASATAVAATADVAPDATSPRWSVPSNWSKTEPGPMIYRSFSVGDNAGNGGVVTVSFFPGDVGGDLANINRWRRQMELSPVEDIHQNGVADSIDVTGGKALLVDFTGGGSKAGKRLVAAIVPHGDNTWFYKLVGDNALVATEKDGFVNFVKNVQYP
jgi:hypothetical protein